MQKIKEEEMEKIIGGDTISGPVIEGLKILADTLLNAGRAVGSALRRLTTKNLCPCKF